MGYEYHEDGLSEQAENFHRAVKSMIEELEAIDWYNQRVDVCKDQALKAILAHNRDEEVEHAAMILEWLRRTTPKFDENLKNYLFTSMPITEIEEAENEEQKNDNSNGSLGIGNLK